jgi:xanthine dehydrogenase small subunit
VRTAVSGLSLVSPRSPAEALRALREDPALVPIAGATDLYVALNAGTLTGERFLDLWRLTALARITRRNGVLSIGALATFSQIIRSRHVQHHLPILVAAAREIGGVQIQNRGTIGGNVGNGSPAGDTLPVLAAADAVLVLQSVDGERRVPFGGFYSGYRATVRRPDELIVAIEIPPLGPARQWFRKVGTRAAQAISKVVMAAIRSERPRIALGSVAPTVIRATRTEEALAAGAGIDEGVRILAEEIRPIDDIRSTAQYREQIAGNLLRRFWSETGP